MILYANDEEKKAAFGGQLLRKHLSKPMHYAFSQDIF
jgi:hypothetical protein